jgi:hypothetical protein
VVKKNAAHTTPIATSTILAPHEVQTIFDFRFSIFDLFPYLTNSTPHLQIPEPVISATFAIRPFTKIAGASFTSAANGTAISIAICVS